MKNYASRAHKGKVAYRTPSRWLASQPEAFKKRAGARLKNVQLKKNRRTPFSYV